MDDARLQKLASNTPAVTAPATSNPSHDAARQRQRQRQRPQNGHNNSQKIEENPNDHLQNAVTKYDVGWRRIVRNFSPSWFSVTMGTGIVGILLITIPFKARWLYWLSVVFFILNTVLFFLALALSFLRYTLYPEIWSVMVDDSNNSLFLGTVPMGFATLVELWIFLCTPYWGPWATTLAWALWMIDSIAAVAVTLSLPIILFRSHNQSLDRITAAQLLPIAATIVAAGTGSEVAEILPHPHDALGTLITSYVLWGLATPMAMTVLVMYYQRLAFHKLPPTEVIVSCFLPLGPLGMGGYTIMYLGKVSRTVFPETELFQNLAVAGDVVYILGAFLALIMWGFGLAWLVFALVSIYCSRPFPFNMGWWGFTFPLGVFAVSTITFGVEMPSMFFRVLGTVLSVAVILLWVVVAIGTVKGAVSGELFYAPCLKNLKDSDKVPGDSPLEDSERTSEDPR